MKVAASGDPHSARRSSSPFPKWREKKSTKCTSSGNNKVGARRPEEKDMPSSHVTRVVEHLRKTLLLRDGVGLSDGQLLDRYVETREEAAFEILVRRHGPMVWGVCRRIVGHTDDAEDAFQATFLVLVRKAASVVPRDAVGNWLYGVACHTALKARAVSVKLRAKEKQVMVMPEPAAVQADHWEELQPLLDQELSRLPDKFRLPLVLCDLEGRSRKDVAAQLRIPEGTLSSRLATARKMLAKRLLGHGFSISGGMLAAVLAQNASACVPAPLVSSTINAATLFAAGQAAMISVKIVTLSEGVLKAMFLMKLKTVMTVLLVLGMVAFGGILLYHDSAVGQQVKAEQKEQTPDLGKDKGKAIKEEMQRLEGTWRAVAVELGGVIVGSPDQINPNNQLVFSGNKCTVMTDPKEPKITSAFTIDPSKKPKWLDTKRDQDGIVRPGIYEFQGDTLKVFIGDSDKRPAEFKTQKGTTQAIFTYKRVEKLEKK
jgi:RNA polymerase sigma factor (sigma-70 family)